MEPRNLNQVAEEAGFWDARLRSPDCTDADRAQFAKWRGQSATHSAEFERLQQIVAIARQEVSRADMRALRDAARRAGARRRWRVPAATAAALALIGIGTAFFVQRAKWEPAPVRSGEQYETQVGQLSTVTLPDGSTVELNAKTLVRIEFTGKQRRVELVSGQALFHVAKNPQRPFIVRAGDREIVAIGTEFDVRRDSSSIRVTLVEGRVAVSRESVSAGSGALASPMAIGRELASKAGGAGSVGRPLMQTSNVFLEPGQQSITQEASGETQVQSVDVQKIIGWRDGRVTLDDFTLADAVAEMNRHSSRQIRLQDPQLAQLRISGVFRAGEQEAFVSALESYFPITVQRNGDAEIVLTARAPH